MEYPIHVVVEEWKQVEIDGVALDYMVSNTGKVYSRKRDKLMKFEDDRGWKRVGIKLTNKKQKKISVHRLVALMFVPGYKEGLVVNHKDGRKWNNCFLNLEWITQRENEDHAVRMGLKARGERHFGNIHSEESIRKVCELLEKGVPYSKIVKKTGVDLSVVYDVKSKKSWTHISDLYNFPEGNHTKYSSYKETIYNLFEQGLKTKAIMKILGIPNEDKQFKSLMNRLRERYNKGAFVVQRLSPRGT